MMHRFKKIFSFDINTNSVKINIKNQMRKFFYLYIKIEKLSFLIIFILLIFEVIIIEYYFYIY
jgi:hypothetical protein